MAAERTRGSSLSRKVAVIVGVVALTFGGLAIACDDDEDNGNGGEPTAAETVPSEDEPTATEAAEEEPTAAE